MSTVGRIDYRTSAYPFALGTASKAKLSCLLLCLVWGYAFSNTLLQLCNTYLYSGYEYHSWLIPPLCMLLVFYKSNSFSRISPSSSSIGLLSIFLLATCWFIASLGNLPAIQQISVILMLPAIILTTHGNKYCRNLILPLMLLTLMIPFGETLCINLQSLFSTFLVKLLVFSNFTGYWESNYIATGNFSYDIFNLIPQFQYISLYITLTLIYSCYKTKSKWCQSTLWFSFIGYPFIFLVIGFYLLIQFENFFAKYNMPQIQLVYLSTILIFLGIITSFSISLLFKQPKKHYQRNDDIDWHNNANYHDQKWATRSILALAIFLILPWAANNIQKNPWESKGQPLLTAPEQLLHWEGPMKNRVSSWNPIYPEATTSFKAQYQQNKNMVEFFVAFYNEPIKGKGLTNTDNQLFDPLYWDKIKERIKTIELNSGKKIAIAETILNRSQSHKVIWSFYYIRNHTIANTLLASIFDSMRIFSNLGEDSGVIALATEVTSDIAIGEQLLTAFLEEIEPKLSQIMHPPRKMM